MKVLQFKPKRPVRVKPVNQDGFKYFNEKQIKLLRKTARDACILALEKGQVTAVKEWMVLDLITSTGLRVSVKRLTSGAGI